MLIIASKIILCLVLVAIIAGTLGYLIAKAKYRKKDNRYEINPILRKPGNIYNKPFILGSPRPSGKDDLTAIEGIDHVLENKLNKIGIFHIEQISKWSAKNVEWVSEYFSLDERIEEENWVSQAKDLLKK